MAQCLTFICPKCGFSLEAWDDGNPYIVDKRGVRRYFYHPSGGKVIEKVTNAINGRECTEDERLKILTERCGNAPDHICRKCGTISKLDPAKDSMVCSKCKSDQLEDTYGLTGKKCTKCDGVFPEGVNTAIS